MMGQDNGKYYQVSTLQALALGFSKSVITVAELLQHGDMGLGTFEDVDGEMIVLDGRCYRAKNNGDVVLAEEKIGVFHLLLYVVFMRSELRLLVK